MVIIISSGWRWIERLKVYLLDCHELYDINNLMKNFLDFFLERTNVSKGCAMLYFDFPDMEKIHDMIDDDDLYEEEGFGLEEETHLTLL